MKKTGYFLLVLALIATVGLTSVFAQNSMAKQSAVIEKLSAFSQSNGQPVTVLKDERGAVTVLSGKLSRPVPVVKIGSAAAGEFLEDHKEIFKMKSLEEELSLASDFTDGFGLEHIKYNQIYKGIPVYKRTMNVHIDKERTVHAVTTNFVPEINLTSVNPGITEKTAIQAVKTDKALMDMPYEKAELVVYYDDATGVSHLAYAVHISSLRYNKVFMVDAATGKAITEFELMYSGSVSGTGTNALGGTVNPLYSYTGTDYPYPSQWSAYMNPTNGTCQRGTYNMIDVSNPTTGNVFGLCAEHTNLSTINWVHSASSTFGTTADGTISIAEQRAAVSAAFNFRSTLNYYKNKHNRNGIDNAGMAVVHITNWYDSADPINAYWSGDPWNYMAFSNAEGSTTYNPLSCAIDVVAHELSHGITDKTSQLAYQNHSGALNESWSDIMGWEVEYYATGQSDWLMGEDIYKSGTSAFRSLSTPTSYSQPDKVGGTYYVTPTSSPSSSNDYGGVHTNSGIPNKVFYLLVNGGTHYSVTVSPFSTTLSTSADQVGSLAYLVNTGGYYTSSTTFDQARTVWESACSALYPGDATKLLNVKRAWYSVNVGTNPDVNPNSITVTAPNGGENWTVGTSRNITWTSTGTISNVKIEYSTNSGTNWTTVVASVSNSGSYAWTVPNTPATTCWVRVSDAAASATNDVSNANFTISSAVTNSITVTAPNGGENWTVGTSRNITWTSTGTISNVKIEYSTNSGTNWTTVVASVSNSGSYAWTVPNTPATTCWVRVSDAAASATNDVSNANFTIATSGGYITAETESNNTSGTANGPVGSGVAVSGSVSSSTDEDYFTFTTGSTGTISVSLSIATSADLDWYLYDASLTEKAKGYTTANPETGSYASAPAGTYYIKVKGYSGATSAYTLNVTYPGAAANSITVTAPNGGENWTVGASKNITWTSTGSIANVKIEYSTNSGTNWTTVVASTTNSGTYAWTVPNTASTTCRVRVSDAAASATNDISNANFTISSGMLYVTETTAANDAISSAQNVASIPAQITGKFTSTSDNYDYYKFPIAANQTISVTMTVPSTVDYDLYLKNSSGTNLKSGTLGTGKTESFTYTNGSTATTLYLAAYRYSGTSTTAYVITVSITSGVMAGNGGGLDLDMPKKTTLIGNYPNPFNPSTSIDFEIAKAGNTTLKIYNLLGQEVRTLVNGYVHEGKHTAIWDGRNNAGNFVSSGLYVYRLQVGDFVATKKMHLVK